MLDILKIIHILAFGLGVAGGLGNMVIAMRVSAFPAEAMPAIGGLRMRFGQVATIGLVLLWITGVWIVAAGYNASLWSSVAWILKMIAVLALTAASIVANVTVMRAQKAGTPPDEKRMGMLGRISAVLSILALIFAVYTFH